MSLGPGAGYRPPAPLAQPYIFDPENNPGAAPVDIPWLTGPKPQQPRRNTPKKPQPRVSLLDQLDRKFSPDETITPRQAAALAESVGLPGKTYAQIAKGESGMRPAAESTDGGYGLWQMTPRVQSPETVAKWQQIAGQHPGGYKNPVANAKMAAYLAGDSTGVSNYYGTGFVTDENAHLKGGASRAQQILGGQVANGRVGTTQPPPQRAIDRFVQNTGSGPLHFSREDPVLQRRIVKLGRESGEPVQINDAFRTYDEQAALYADRASNPNPVAAPGSSRHESGLAFDANLTPEQQGLIDDVGLAQPVANDPVHYELAGRAAQRAGTYSAPTGSGGGYSTPTGPSAPFTSSSPAAPSGGASLRGLLQGGRRGAQGGPASALAARAPQPRTNRDEDEEETLTELLARLGRRVYA